MDDFIAAACHDLLPDNDFSPLRDPNGFRHPKRSGAPTAKGKRWKAKKEKEKRKRMRK